MQSRAPILDRRGAPRVPLSLRVLMEAGGDPVVSTSVDLSASGIFLEMQDPVPVGTRLRLSFSMGGQEKTLVEVEGRAARSISRDEAGRHGGVPGIGVEFQKFRCGHVALLEDLTRRLGHLEGAQPEKLSPVQGGPRNVRTPLERRRPPRAAGAFPVLWGLRPPPDRKGQVLNVSAAGAFIATDEPVTAGTHLYLLFERQTRNGPETVKAVARVVRVNPAGQTGSDEPAGMGIVFDRDSVDDSVPLFLEQALQRLSHERMVSVAVVSRKASDLVTVTVDPVSGAAAADPAHPGDTVQAVMADAVRAATGGVETEEEEAPRGPVNPEEERPILPKRQHRDRDKASRDRKAQRNGGSPGEMAKHLTVIGKYLLAAILGYVVIRLLGC